MGRATVLSVVQVLGKYFCSIVEVHVHVSVPPVLVMANFSGLLAISADTPSGLMRAVIVHEGAIPAAATPRTYFPRTVPDKAMPFAVVTAPLLGHTPS